jgi:putative spermidine/putrescine transport system ATP-binding protein
MTPLAQQLTTSTSRESEQNGRAGASVELRELTKHYGDTVAVEGASLAVRPGEFVTLLGPSGSGKTTTLNMVAGFVQPTSGDISMDGRPIDALRPHRRNIGMVFQSYALFPHMTAFENVAFPLRRRKVPRPEVRRRVHEALELTGLGRFAERRPRELSGGQQQRVALARAIVFRPRLLLMDEPLGALDKKLRETLQLEIKRIHSELGITVIYVTHDQDEALVLSDQIAVFRDGRVEQLGAPTELYERPGSLFVASFLGESNVFPGRVVRDREGYAVTGDGYRLRSTAPADLPVPCAGAIVVRPERVRVLVSSDAHADHNVLTGVVRRVVYLGSARRLEIELAGSHIAIAREQAGSQSAAAEGDAVRIGWATAGCVVLPDRNGG